MIYTAIYDLVKFSHNLMYIYIFSVLENGIFTIGLTVIPSLTNYTIKNGCLYTDMRLL